MTLAGRASSTTSSPCPRLWLCHSEELPESLPTTARTRRRRSPNNTGAAVLRSSSPPRGAVKTPNHQVNCNVPYNFPKNEYKAAVMQVWNASQCRDQACSCLPEPMLEGPRKSPLPTRANAQKNHERLMIACLCQGFVFVFAEFFPSFHLGFLSESFVQMSSKLSICSNHPPRNVSLC